MRLLPRSVCPLSWLALATVLAFPPTALPAEDSPALKLAKQLNQAFVEVADRAAGSVVIVRVAYSKKRLQSPFRFSPGDEDDESFWELIPKEFREQFERRRNREKEKAEEPAEKPDEGATEKPDDKSDLIWSGQGSGVIFREDGYLVTNGHVVEDAVEIEVVLKNGKTYKAKLKGSDPRSDIAVLKVDAQGLPAARFADSDKTRVGEFAIAVGAPFNLDYSVTFGHVSAKGRGDVLPRFNFASAMMDQDFIQTDASINPGNSGGPLLNIEGEVIGINTLIRGMNTGIGFAVPASLVKEVATSLIEKGRVVRAWLGVAIRDLRDDQEHRGRLKDVEDGVIISNVLTDGPAAGSDLRAGDVVTAVDGKAVATSTQLRNEVRRKPVGQAVTLDIVRRDSDGTAKNIKVKVKPGEAPAEAPVVAGKPRSTPAETKGIRLGVTVETLSDELADKYGIKAAEGVVITDIQNGSLAEKKGLLAGDVITDVNQKPVKTDREFRNALKNADLKKGITLNLISKGVSRFEVMRDEGR